MNVKPVSSIAEPYWRSQWTNPLPNRQISGRIMPPLVAGKEKIPWMVLKSFCGYLLKVD